ncbi:hypothetical protein [Embleya sp. AB8]|uniref:hypothetical protein n=1 Tax=Embleya sp. AB8 TaxID=3156304 RepID=UPI003C789719
MPGVSRGARAPGRAEGRRRQQPPPVGEFLANARKPLETRTNTDRWARRRPRLDAIDPGWNPAGHTDPARRWPPAWQRMLAVVRLHLESGGTLAELAPGHSVGGEDVGAWPARQQRPGAGLTPAHRAALAGLGVEPAAEVPAQRAAPDRWTLTLAAAANPTVVSPSEPPGKGWGWPKQR